MTVPTNGPQTPPDPGAGVPEASERSDLDRQALRRRDFWAALVLMGASLFFLWRTSLLPFLKASAAGVEAEWYNSAALVPFGVFGILLVLALGLLVQAVRDGGAPWRGRPPRDADEAGPAGPPRPWMERPLVRVAAVAAILLVYIFALVPRVDFTLASALAIVALIFGFHEGRGRLTLASLVVVILAGGYAIGVHGPQAEWGRLDDDWVALASFVLLSAIGLVEARSQRGAWPRYAVAAPVVALVVPLILVCAMAFGFRQNVPARTGLVFGAMEYHYYVTLRPWLGRS